MKLILTEEQLKNIALAISEDDNHYDNTDLGIRAALNGGGYSGDSEENKTDVDSDDYDGTSGPYAPTNPTVGIPDSDEFEIDKKSGGKSIGNGVAYKPLWVHITKKKGRKIKYLAIHYTAGGNSKSGMAAGCHGIFEKRKASADFAVDDSNMVQFNPDPLNYYCWAVGDGGGKNGITNSNSISIEICSSLKPGTSGKAANHEGWYFTEAALKNAIRLAKILMSIYNIPKSNVVRHYDASGKLCPGLVGWNDGELYTTSGKRTGKRNNSKIWYQFKNKL